MSGSYSVRSFDFALEMEILEEVVVVVVVVVVVLLLLRWRRWRRGIDDNIFCRVLGEGRDERGVGGFSYFNFFKFVKLCLLGF